MRGFIRISIVVVTAVALCGFACPAKASTIIYTVSGIASGKIGAINFTNALVTVSMTADTTGVTSQTFEGLAPLGVANVGTATVNIPGIGTAAITGCTSTPSCTNSTVIYSSVTPLVGFVFLPPQPYVIFGTVDFPPSTDDFTGLGAVGSTALAGYDLRTSVGPISGTPGGVFYAENELLHTTLGDLSFTSNLTPTMGPGVFTATIVPEPSSLLMLSSGIFLFAGLACGIRRRN
jgi:hypothetical protein